MNYFVANIVLDDFDQGGPIMWPIVLVLIAGLTVVLERALWWANLRRRLRSHDLLECFDAISSGEFERALQIVDGPSDPFLQTVRQGLLHAHSSLLGAMQMRASDELEKGERRQWVIGTFITLAPLLGLLGTITGIMRSFNVIGEEQLAPTKVSGGIAEALIATACGLGIAIFCLIPYNYFNRQSSKFRSQLERTINHVELLVESAKHHGHDLEEFSRRRAVAETQPAAGGSPCP